MTSWLLETLLWTAALIALVLLVRRPVARWFGPQVAYALWALPVLRLFLPPIELPAWMNPDPVSAAPGGDFEFLILDPAIPVATQDGAAVSEAAASVAPSSITPVPGIELGTFLELGFAAWLIGAAIFLYLRFAAYFRLRDELLEGSSEVGRNGKVRLIETAGTEAPLAFGVIDKVIALPEGFLAQPDRTARDLALAHEMAHHKGQDLLINVLVQPLFAMHWFNPLGRYGWLALRRDQEAACDARVIAAEPDEAKEAYASLIVSFAAGPNIALAAPMACPVLGEKSIIHRLRSLKMNETSNSRRIAGRLMLGAAVIALPLTASISYAAEEVPAAPVAPQASEAPPAPPAPPAPDAPPAPPAPDAPRVIERIIEIDPDSEGASDVVREENVFVIRRNEGDREVREERREVNRIVLRSTEGMSEEEREKIILELREGLAEADKVMGDLPRIIEQSISMSQMADGQTVIKMECDNNSDEPASTWESADGTRTVMICQTRIMAEAVEGLREAREEIAEDSEMDPELRERILKTLDEKIESWERDAR